MHRILSCTCSVLFLAFTETEPAVLRDDLQLLRALIVGDPAERDIALDATLPMLFPNTPSGRHHLSLCAVVHPVSEESWHFHVCFFVELEDGDVGSP